MITVKLISSAWAFTVLCIVYPLCICLDSSNVAVTTKEPCAPFGERHGGNTKGHSERIFINLNGDFVMAHQSVSAQEAKNYHENSLKYWRSWGSWFSWGSPVGLGLFLISIAFSIWLLSQAFGWN